MKLENKIIEATLGENLPEVIIEKEEDFRNLLGNSDIVLLLNHCIHVIYICKLVELKNRIFTSWSK